MLIVITMVFLHGGQTDMGRINREHKDKAVLLFVRGRGEGYAVDRV